MNHELRTRLNGIIGVTDFWLTRFRPIEWRSKSGGSVGQTAADKKGVQISLEVEEGIPLRVDPDHLKQILIYLLDNTIKFTP